MVDFLNKNTELFRLREKDNNNESPVFTFESETEEKKGIFIEKPHIIQTNAIEEELKSFYHSIINHKPPKVSIDDGYSALNVAQQILDKLKNGVQAY